MNNIIKAISETGFPIVACIGMAYLLYKTYMMLLNNYFKK